MIVSILVVVFILVLNFSSNVLVIPMAIGLIGGFVMLCAYTTVVVYVVGRFNIIVQMNSL